jgi:hypothetical protein
MENRTMLLLQALMALCLWAIVLLSFWPGGVELRTEILSQGIEGVAMQTLLVAFLLISLEVGLFALFILRGEFGSAGR